MTDPTAGPNTSVAEMASSAPTTAAVASLSPQQLQAELVVLKAAADQVAAAIPNQTDRLTKITSVIQAWFVANIHDSPVSRSVDGFNHLGQVLPALAQALNEEI